MTKDEAEEALRTAIHNHAVALEIIEPDELLNEWAIIAHWQRVEADGKSRITTHTPDGMPHHHLAGLYAVGMQILDRGYPSCYQLVSRP